MEDIRQTSWYMENLALLTGFSTSQVVSWISSINSRGVFFFQGEYEKRCSQKSLNFLLLVWCVGLSMSIYMIVSLGSEGSHVAREWRECVFSGNIFFLGGGKGLWERLWETCFFFFWSSFSLQPTIALDLRFFLGLECFTHGMGGRSHESRKQIGMPQPRSQHQWRGFSWHRFLFVKNFLFSMVVSGSHKRWAIGSIQSCRRQYVYNIYLDLHSMSFFGLDQKHDAG